MGSAVRISRSSHFVRRALSNAFHIRLLYLIVNAYYVREVRNKSGNSGDDVGFGYLGSSFSENGSTRGVLIDDTAAIYSSSNRYLLDNMSCARAIDDTAVNNL